MRNDDSKEYRELSRIDEMEDIVDGANRSRRPSWMISRYVALSAGGIETYLCAIAFAVTVNNGECDEKRQRIKLISRNLLSRQVPVN